MLEMYAENEMLGDYNQLVKEYCNEDNEVILPAGTKLVLVEAVKKQGCPAIYRIEDKGIEVLIYDFFD
ncbi:MAG: hypothetical protein NC218_02030 [Acetobacter sp.]|nr:hypothetical protein [Acetobacter sp.]